MRNSQVAGHREILGLEAKQTQALELQKALTLEMMQDHYLKSIWTHVFIEDFAENAVRNGGSGVYICRSDGTTSSLSIPAGWYCQKQDCRHTGKGSSKTSSTPPLHLIQRSQGPSETEAEISLETEKQWI